MPLLKGHTPDIVDANVNELCKTGMSRRQATMVAMKHSNKSRSLERKKQRSDKENISRLPSGESQGESSI